MQIDDSTFQHQLNPTWYEPARSLAFSEDGSNSKLASFGARLQLPCGGAWFLLHCKDEKLALCIKYAADSYNHIAKVYLFNGSCLKWHELERHLLLYPHTIHVTNSKEDFLADLGIDEKNIYCNY